MFDIFTILNIVSKVFDDSSAYDAVSQCRKVEPLCTCGISQNNVYKITCRGIDGVAALPNFTHVNMDKLNTLDLSGNRFPKLYGSRGFDSINIRSSSDVQLTLETCQISSVSTSFINIIGRSVTLWKLSNNQLETLPSLREMKVLQTLDLSNNRFKTIPQNLCHAPRLANINMARNRFAEDISHQITNLHGCQNLQKVYWDSGKFVDCSCKSLGHYMWGHSTGPPFIERSTSQYVRSGKQNR